MNVQTGAATTSLRSPHAAAAVEALAVTKTFGRGETAFQALRGVDLTVARGEFVMLAGPSGSGKTTLLSILGCVLTATSGVVHLFGENVTARPESELPRLRQHLIGFIFQGHNLIASLTARENVALPLQMRGVPVRTSRTQAEQMLARVGLADKLDNKPSDLSGGQRQRIAIARALVGNPPLVLADEPTAALDAHSGLTATTLLKEVCQERAGTVVVVTHDSRIFHLADRIVHIEDGCIGAATGSS